MKRLFLALIAAVLAGVPRASGFGGLAIDDGTADGLSMRFGDGAGSAAGGNGAAGAGAALPPKWYGQDSRQAGVKFTSYMHYLKPTGYAKPVSELLNDPELAKEIRGLVELQLRHMYGAFTMHPAFVDNPGIPSGNFKLTLLAAEKIPRTPYAKIIYSYEDTMVFSTDFFDGGGRTSLEFVLPLDPLRIYRKGLSWSGARHNPCTDDHYNSENDFWYFWNPYKEGCPIADKDLVAVKAEAAPMAVTRETYPEYAKLYGGNGNGNVLQISYLVGIDKTFEAGDNGRKIFENVFVKLKDAGFRVEQEFENRKLLSLDAGGKRVSIEMQLLNPNSADYAEEAVRGMMTADIFYYNGHSGLGGYLHPIRLARDAGRPLVLPKDKYQIFVFQGCSTYAYYNKAFFDLKSSELDPKGTKNLDIVTTGTSADFSTGAQVGATFLTSVATGARPSWQTILDRIHVAEGNFSALTHVNGDEDNPHTP